ncbi:MAG: hypothetical protein QMD71_02875 [bacterium]|nr:hypothetical protein [bacterium]
MKEEKNYSEIKEFVVNKGIALFGVCNIEKLKEKFHPSIREVAESLPYGISIGYRLSDSVLSTIKGAPTLIYKHHYKTVNWILDQVAEQVSNFIQSKGKNAVAIPASQTVDWEYQIGHLPHSLIGRECGLGWIGRSGLLVNPDYGAKVRYATILTDFPLKLDKPISDGGCNDCKKCIEVCPALAITESGYDKGKCISKLREFSKLKGIGVYICGVCVSVCGGRYGS